jgi:PAS domain S-box-containing protein
MEENKRKFRELLENANIIIAKMDRQGRITFFGDFAQRFFGYPLDEILGKDAGILVPSLEGSLRRAYKSLK